MHATSHWLIGAAVCLTAGGTALGALTTRDSSAFINDIDSSTAGDQTASYEATAIPQNATPAWTSPGDAQTYGVSGGELTLTTTTGNSRAFYDTTGWWGNDADRATGYTVEFRMRVDQINDTANRGPTLVRIGDGIQKVELEWRANSVEWNPFTASAGSVTIDPSSYLTYRVAYDPAGDNGNGAYAAWINGTLVSDTLSGASSTADHLLFGDSSGTRYGGTTTWDYIRWDTTGAYAPVPEPASVALLSLGGLLIAARRR